MSIREFVVGALHNEMGLEASADPDLLKASAGERVLTPSGMELDGSKDKINPPRLRMITTETRLIQLLSTISSFTFSTISSQGTASKPR